MDFTELTSAIQNNTKIALFRHEHPDCDAYGSTFGLQQFIYDNYEGKDVRVLGFDTTSQGNWPQLDTAEDAFLKDSIAIVLDTANKERVDDARYALCKRVIKVDHHPNNDPFGDVNLVNEQASATCEILAGYIKSLPQAVLSTTCASYLYKGLLTDTLCYKTSNTTANTLEAGAYLASAGIAIPELNRELFDRDLNEFKFQGWLMSNFKMFDDSLAYVVIPMDVLQEWNLTGSKARNFVNVLGSVKEFESWCFFTARVCDTGIVYDGSLRSKHVTINDIAQKYHGGGHKNASGVKNLSEQGIQDILNDINTRIHESM